MTEPEGAKKLRHAATVMLVREAVQGFEVLLLRRSKALDFAADAYVFPGGSVDGDDRLVWDQGFAKASNPESFSSRLDLDVPAAMSHYVAAIREAFEETGILLGDSDSHALDAARDRLLAKDTTFLTLVQELGITLSLDRLSYVAHWVTPEAVPKRFDTRFFVAVVSRNDFAKEDMSEIVAHEWVTPTDALARFREGSLPMVLPTIRNLEFLAKYTTLHELANTMADLEAVPTIMPRMLRTEDGVIPIEPNDPRYETVAKTEMGKEEALPMSPSAFS